jgi:hypothetical protein
LIYLEIIENLVKTVWIFSDRIRNRIRLQGFRYVRIQVRMFNIRYRIHIRILKSYIYDVRYPIISYPTWLTLSVFKFKSGQKYETLSVFKFKSGQKYENKCNISDIRPYPIRFHPLSLVKAQICHPPFYHLLNSIV